VAAAKGAAVHDVVVDEGEGVEYLQAGGGLQDMRAELIGKNAVSGEAQAGTDALAAYCYHVAKGIVQTGGLVLEFDSVKELFYSGIYDGV
jgi:hypothetical protein